MKFRTDFVTNSSSSSYITIIAVDQNGIMKKAWLEYENAAPVEALDPNGIKTGEDLLQALTEQLVGSGYLPDCLGIADIAAIQNVWELTYLRLKDREVFDFGTYSSQKVLVGDSNWIEPSKSEWEKTWRYAKSNAEEKYPDAHYDWFRDQLKKITQHLGADAVVYVPSFILNGKVVEIGRNAFAGLEHITEVIIPEGVVVIGPSAFSGCTNLKTVCLPSTLLEIGAKAFAGCPKLGKPIVPSKTKVAEDAFDISGNNSAQKKITVKSGAAPTDPAELDKYKNLFKLTVNKSSVRLLARKTTDAELVFPETIAGLPVTIDLKGFSNDKNLKKLVWPATETSGENAFQNCPKLKEVVIPETLTYFEGNEFLNTPFWDSFPGLVVFNHILLGYNGSEPEVVLPPDVREIAGEFISRAPNLRVLTIPETVEVLHSCCFTLHTAESFLTPSELRKQADELKSLPQTPGIIALREEAESLLRTCLARRKAEIPLEVCIPGDHLTMKNLQRFTDCPNLTLRAPTGSKVEAYAKKNNVPFKAL